MCVHPKETQEHTPHEPIYGWGWGVLSDKPKRSRNIIIEEDFLRRLREDYMRDKDYSDGMTQQEIADVLGVSRNAVQQMERNIIRKLQREFEKRGLKKEDYLGDDK